MKNTRFKAAIRSLYTRQFVLFIACSGVAAAVNFTSRIGFSKLTGFYGLAIVLAYFCGMLTAFTLNKFITFKGGTGKDLHFEIGGFVCINLLGLLQTFVVSMVMVHWILPALGVVKHVHLIGHAFGVAAPLFTSFIGHKYITFGRHSFAEAILLFRRKRL